MCEALKGKEWLKATLLCSPEQDICPQKLVCVMDQPCRPALCTRGVLLIFGTQSWSQAQLLEVNLPQSSCIVSDGYHRVQATITKAALDRFREEFPEQSLTGTMVKIQKACFEIRPQQVGAPHLHFLHSSPISVCKFVGNTSSVQRKFVLAVKDFMWIGGRPLDPIGEPIELDDVPAAVELLEILLNDDGDDDRIPSSQQVHASVCRISMLPTALLIPRNIGACICLSSGRNCAGETRRINRRRVAPKPTRCNCIRSRPVKPALREHGMRTHAHYVPRMCHVNTGCGMESGSHYHLLLSQN